ncbi:MAG TPA: SRPBCC domain-containing protein [Burkholderiales bacterium]
MEQARVKEQPSLRLIRFFPVEPEKVWRAWTEPQALTRWFGGGPERKVSRAEVDLRAGGRYRICFGGADGNENEVQGSYREVAPHRRLSFTWTWPRSTPERESLVTIEFNAVPRGTEMVFRHENFFDEKARNDHQRGWSAAFAILEKALLAERPKLTLKRVYPVSPEKVYRAWTDGAALRQWWNQAESPGWIAELDVRVGGRYRLMLRDPEGNYHDIRGVYSVVEPNRKLVFTWNIHDAPPDAASTVTVLLSPVDDGTELEFTLDPVFDPRAADGWRGAFKRLEVFLSTD